MMSATSATYPTPSGSMASVQMRRPVSSRALASSLSPGRPRPWNAYGEVRGFQAPPRRITAPASFTRRAASMICRSLSTEHGPAMVTTSVPPTVTPPGSRTTVFSAFHSRLTCLYGRVTWMTSWTPGSPSSREASTRPSLPTSPTAVRCEPGIGCARYPISSITATTRWTYASVARCRITISTLAPSDLEPIPVLRGRHGPLEPGPRLPRRVRSLYRRIEVGQDEPLGRGPAGQLTRPERREVAVDRHRLRERALREQQVAPCGPARQLGARSRVAGVDETALRSGEADRDALRRVRYAAHLEAHVAVEREGLAVPHVQDADREAGVEQPLPVPLRQRLHEPHHAGRAQDDERLLPRRRRRGLQRGHQHRQLGPVVRVEMGQHDMGDLGPRQPELGQAVQRAGAAVEQDLEPGAAHPVAGRSAGRGGRDRAGADGDQFHALAIPSAEDDSPELNYSPCRQLVQVDPGRYQTAVVGPSVPHESRIARRAAGHPAPVASSRERLAEVRSRDETPHRAPAQVDDLEPHLARLRPGEPDAGRVLPGSGERVREVLVQKRRGRQRAVGKRGPLRREARRDSDPEQRGGPEERRGAPRRSPAHRA